jgi:nucleoside-diphosphate-sugar epimerase
MDLGYERDGFITITGDGLQTRDWTHVGDVAECFRLALESDLSGCVLDVCTGVQTSLQQIADWLGVNTRFTDPRPGDALSLVSNPIPAYDRLGFMVRRRLRDTLLDSFPAIRAAHEKVAQ